MRAVFETSLVVPKPYFFVVKVTYGQGKGCEMGQKTGISGEMILTFTDFGATGPYRGQMQAVLAQNAPGHALIDLMVDAPCFNPKASAYLLAALLDGVRLPQDCVILAVVDPGVGGPRLPILLRTSTLWIVGPDNGLMEIVRRRWGGESWRIDWRPPHLSATFHGRDLFAPVAARLAMGESPVDIHCTQTAMTPFPTWPDDLAEIIYIDAYGNVMTGWRAAKVDPDGVLMIKGFELRHAQRFGAAPRGQAFWYANSSGLVEIAMQDDSAALRLGLTLGDPWRWAECHETIAFPQSSI